MAREESGFTHRWRPILRWLHAAPSLCITPMQVQNSRPKASVSHVASPEYQMSLFLFFFVLRRCIFASRPLLPKCLSASFAPLMAVKCKFNAAYANSGARGCKYTRLGGCNQGLQIYGRRIKKGLAPRAHTFKSGFAKKIHSRIGLQFWLYVCCNW